MFTYSLKYDIIGNYCIKGGYMWDLFLRIVLSGVLAGVIGLEREFRSKDAGLKTHFLVGIGSALIMIVSKYGFYDIISLKGIALDPSRIAAQVVSGISFLGAGTIIVEKHFVRGLTTAAGIWTTAGIGIALGSGLYAIGIFSTILVLIGLEILNRLFKNTAIVYSKINIWTRSEEIAYIYEFMEENKFTITKFKFKKTHENNSKITLIQATLKGIQKNNSQLLVDKLYENKDILKIEMENA